MVRLSCGDKLINKLIVKRVYNHLESRVLIFHWDHKLLSYVEVVIPVSVVAASLLYGDGFFLLRKVLFTFYFCFGDGFF